MSDQAIPPCPGCGGKCVVQRSMPKVWWVACSDVDCGYTGPEGTTEFNAITAHSAIVEPPWVDIAKGLPKTDDHFWIWVTYDDGLERALLSRFSTRTQQWRDTHGHRIPTGRVVAYFPCVLPRRPSWR